MRSTATKRTRVLEQEEQEEKKRITVKVPFDDFVRHNKIMLRLMFELEKYHPHPIPTNRLYLLSRVSNNYGGIALCKGVDMGYITRKRVQKPPGEKGNDMILNNLTERGLTLLKQLREYQPRLEK